MRKTFLILPVLLVLTGCAGMPDPAIQQRINDTIAQIQGITASVCRFLPTAQTVANILATFTGTTATVDIANAIANSICGAVTAKAARPGGAPPTVRGVIIHGDRV